MGLDREAIREKAERKSRDQSVVPMWRKREPAGDAGADPDFAARLAQVNEAGPEEAARLCQIDLEDLVKTLSQHAPLYAYVASKYYHARRDRAAAEREVDRIRAQVFNEIQEEDPDLAANKTERRVEDAPEVNQAEDELLEARRHEARLRGILEGLKERGSMLNHVAAIQRREMETYQ